MQLVECVRSNFLSPNLGQSQHVHFGWATGHIINQPMRNSTFWACQAKREKMVCGAYRVLGTCPRGGPHVESL